jgi:ketosteroid isomerase-like protein
LSRNWDAVMAMCTEDITMQMPGAPPISGEAFRAWLETFPAIKSVEWEITHAEGTADLAVVRGSAAQVVEQDGETVRMPGKYCDIFRKDDDGRWLMACISWMPDTP